MIKQTFIEGKLDKSTDERMFPKGFMRDAVNVRVSGSEGSDVGAIETCLGNQALTEFNLTNAMVIGKDKDESNLLLYFFITSDEYDFLIEYSKVTETPTIVLQSSNGGVLNFSRDSLITGLNKIINGDTEKDLYAWTDDRNPPRCINIDRCKTNQALDGVDWFVEDDISLIKKPPKYPPTLTFNQTINKENFLEDKFISFAYRYKYLDFEYSAISPFTNYAFQPNRFDLDYETMENIGMINSFNEVVVSFDTGSKRVIGIDILFKESNSNSVYIIERFDKQDEGWVLENETKTLTFTNSKIYKVLPSDELYRAYDNVPRLAKAQELIGNRLVFSNYLEGYNLKDNLNVDIKMNYDLSLDSSDLSYNQLDYTTAVGGDIDGAEFINIDFTGVELVQGLIISFDFSLAATAGVGSFLHNFTYILPQDYANCNALTASAEYIYFVETLMSDVFANGVVVTTPDDTVSTTYTSWTIAGGDATHLVIRPGKVIFSIDNTIDPIYTVNMGFSISATTDISYRVITSDSSLKTNRSYEVGIIYLDDYGRSSTVLTIPSATLFIDQSHSLSKNRIRTQIHNKPPYWATQYKFVVKESKSGHNTMYVNFFLEDKLYRWVKLEGTNRDKVKEGDVLIVKSDLSGPIFDIRRLTVLEVTSQSENFILNNWEDDAKTIESIEESGLYMKVKPVGISMDNDVQLVQNYSKKNYPLSADGKGKVLIGGTNSNILGQTTESLAGYLDANTGLYVDNPITEGVRISLFFETIQRPSGGGGAVRTYSQTITSNGNYDNFQLWWEAEVVDLGSFYDAVNWSFYRDGTTNYLRLDVEGLGDFAPSIEGIINIRYSTGDMIFETEPKETFNEIFYETGQTFDIVGGVHLGNEQNQVIGVDPAISLLEAFNCYAMGNGAESYQIKDKVNAKSLNIDLRPATTSLEEYKEVRRFADFTYSEPYNGNTSINGLNEFNLYKANFKDDLEKKYGSVQKLYARDTDLVVFQEDKVSKVLYGKDLLSNADGTSNISSIESVLSQQITYAGEYGISKCPESFAQFGNRVYWNDPKRGTPLRLSIDGITELAMYNMEDFFKDIFRAYPSATYQGGYDPYFDEYLLSIEVPNRGSFTIGFSEKVKGWTSLYTFSPEGIIGLSNDLYTFKNGELWKHNSEIVPRNNFYGVQYTTKVVTILNDSPSNDKIFKSIVQESNRPWTTTILTNLANSTIAISEFVEKESRYFAYVRNNEDQTNLRGNVAQGVGNLVSFSGNTVTFNSVPVEASIGDSLMDGSVQPPVLLGTIASITGNVITLDALLVTPTEGIFCFVLKNARIEGGDIRGYFAEVTLETENTEFTELFAVNAHVSRSDLYSKE